MYINVGDFYHKYLNIYGKLFSYEFYSVAKIEEDKIFISCIEFIREINNSKEEYFIHDREYCFNIDQESTINFYLRIKICGEITFQDILEISKKYNPEIAYKIIRKKFLNNSKR